MVNKFTVIAFVLMLAPLAFGQLTKWLDLSFRQILVISGVWCLLMVINFVAFFIANRKKFFQRGKIVA